MAAIKNMQQLVKNGVNPEDRKARGLVLKSLNYALKAVDPKEIIRTRVSLEDHHLKVSPYNFNLKKFKHIYVIGGGKASGSMAEALEQVLDDHITNGFVNVLHGTKNKTKIVKLQGASHPVPDEAGVKGTRRMLQLAKRAKENDLIICLISGGGSSLMPLPRGNIKLADKKRITDALLKSGATINEINTIRKHISDFKGGWLAKTAYPATILNLILSDVMGDPLDFIASGPTVPDSTTFGDAAQVLKKYGLWANAPSTIKKVLSAGDKGLIPETPKTGDKAFEKVYNIVVGNNRLASQAVCESLKSDCLNTVLLTSALEGEAKQVGTVLASIAREVTISGNPVRKPCGIAVGGETTVVVTGKGKGGRNQEIALASALKLQGLKGVVVASLTTDGVDGPTDAAGAIVDSTSLVRAKKLGMIPEKFLAENDSYHFFARLGDLIITGPTGTNVNDVTTVVVL